eukprot:GDKI01042993.1.p1 GENE.GDKI01042993.1~~GDKI01042993.1.p1  ORF type:complete len:443 (-),score=72.54 GDKI01042993.1:50-1378(-)
MKTRLFVFKLALLSVILSHTHSSESETFACRDMSVCTTYDCKDAEASYRSGHECNGYPYFNGGYPKTGTIDWATTEHTSEHVCDNTDTYCRHVPIFKTDSNRQPECVCQKASDGVCGSWYCTTHTRGCVKYAPRVCKDVRSSSSGRKKCTTKCLDYGSVLVTTQSCTCMEYLNDAKLCVQWYCTHTDVQVQKVVPTVPTFAQEDYVYQCVKDSRRNTYARTYTPAYVGERKGAVLSGDPWEPTNGNDTTNSDALTNSDTSVTDTSDTSSTTVTDSGSDTPATVSDYPLCVEWNGFVEAYGVYGFMKCVCQSKMDTGEHFYCGSWACNEKRTSYWEPNLHYIALVLLVSIPVWFIFIFWPHLCALARDITGTPPPAQGVYTRKSRMCVFVFVFVISFTTLIVAAFFGGYIPLFIGLYTLPGWVLIGYILNRQLSKITDTRTRT